MDLRRLLIPLEVLYRVGLGVHQRWQTRKPPFYPEVPTIGVGNLRVGGTGKTPMVLWLARQLLPGYTVGIVTRGYRRKTKRPLWIRPGQDPKVQEIGDEPYLLYQQLDRAVHLWVGTDRVQGIQTLSRAGVQVLLLDDNFQDLRVRPHVQIVLVVPEDLSGSRLLPAGFLREPLEALGRADLLVFNVKDEPLTLPSNWDPPHPVWLLRYQIRFFREAHSGKRVRVQDFQPQRVMVVCGIADPQSFLRMLVRLGLPIVAVQTYWDHTWYSDRRLESIRKLADRVQADVIVTTEKDWVRMEGRLPRVWIPELELVMENEQGFFDTLAQRLGMDLPKREAG